MNSSRGWGAARSDRAALTHLGLLGRVWEQAHRPSAGKGPIWAGRGEKRAFSKILGPGGAAAGCSTSGVLTSLSGTSVV